MDSSLAYQGGGKHLGIDNVLNINLFATENTLPDMTILFDIPPEVGLQRISANSEREVNRLDLEKISFYNDTRNAFLSLAEKFNDRYVVIDASKSIEEVFEQAYRIIEKKINELSHLSSK